MSAEDVLRAHVERTQESVYESRLDDLAAELDLVRDRATAFETELREAKSEIERHHKLIAKLRDQARAVIDAVGPLRVRWWQENQATEAANALVALERTLNREVG